jgi:hypothetical protein
MTRRERRTLLAVAIVLAVLCSALFARAVFAQRAVDLSRAQARAALFREPTMPTSDAATRTMLGWSGGTGQLDYWQALQRFRVVTPAAVEDSKFAIGPNLAVIFRLEETATYLRSAAQDASSPALRSRLWDMLGLAYYDDARLHAGQVPIEPQLEQRAVVAFRQAVRNDASNDAAKTNLEVLLRKLLASHIPPPGHSTPVPDVKRVGGVLKLPTGAPEFNGAHGHKIRGGY